MSGDDYEALPAGCVIGWSDGIPPCQGCGSSICPDCNPGGVQ